MTAVGVQDNGSQPTRGNRLKDVGDMMDTVHVELEFVNVYQIDTPGEI